MTIPSTAAILTALVYLCLLFAVAHWGDLSGRRVMRRRTRSTVYALALAVYCSSWTFYGSVGLASRAGLDFLAIYIGPMLVIGLGYPLVLRVIGIAKTQNITSVADFVAARYGKSERVAALVTIIAVVAAVPYIALQLKAVSASVQVFLLRDGGPSALSSPIFGDLAFVVALVLAGFSVAFGTRHADATEHQNGLVLAIALESLVKLASFLIVGAYVTYGLFDGFHDLAERTGRSAAALDLIGPTSGAGSFATLVLLAACAGLLLPRQFHMTVVENRAAEDLKRAAWLFPLYLVLINLFVLPLAVAGLQVFPADGTDRDMTVIALPLEAGSGFVALLSLLGGLSAATAMVIVETIAVSIMVANHLVLPLILRRRAFRTEPRRRGDHGLGRLVLLIRRAAIVGLTLGGYAYYHLAGDAELASIGLLSFAAIAQIAPAFVAGLFWRRATALGASAGLTLGLAVWAYTLLLPVLLDGPEWALLLADGPFGFRGLRPTALAGTDMAQLTHGVVWSLGLNVLAFLVFSLRAPSSALERLQASVFVGDTRMSLVPPMRLLRSSVSVDELSGAVGRFVGEDRTRRSFAGFARSRGMTLVGADEADIHLLRYAEHLLASVIGVASSRLALSILLRGRDLSTRDALRLLDEGSAALQHNRDLLQHALDHAQQGITVLDRDLRLLSWNQAFIDLYGFPPDLVRIGVGLEEIVRTNAERGAYGPGNVDDLVATRLHSMMHETGPVRVRLYPSGRVISVRSNHLPGGGLLATYTDVTDNVTQELERERENETLERRVRERTEELTRLNEELTRAKRDADEANVSKTRFLAAASHDILQPLNAARLYATSLSERTREGDEAKLAENVEASLDAVEEILTTLLEISRLDTGALTPQWSSIGVDELLRELDREFGPAARAKGLSIRFAPSRLHVRSDRRLLRRLLQNLVSNAVKYTPSGRVLVGARRRGKRLRLEVWDTGLGVPANKQKTIFREFKRLSAGARAAPGSGLGLSIVDRIAKTLDVEIGLASEPGRGSVFRVSVPVAPAAAAGPVPVAARKTAPIAPLRRLSVLAIDNEPAVLDGMRELLAGWGLDIRTATTIAAARELVAANALPEVVIADFHLDDGDGLLAVAAIREAVGRELPAVLITADHTPDLRRAAEERRIRVLNKPLKPAALRALLSGIKAAGAEAAE